MELFENTIRTIAPNTAVFSDIGPDLRWVGNEKGIVNTTNWNKLDTAGFTRGAGAPSQDTLNTGNRHGKVWMSAECDVSIRPGWFYHAAEDSAVKTPEQLFDLYLKSAGRGATLLLNVPPDSRGLFSAYDSAALMGFQKLRAQSFDDNHLRKATVTIQNGINGTKTVKLTDSSSKTYVTILSRNYIQAEWAKPTTLNCVVLKEAIQLGQFVSGFYITFLDENNKEIKQVKGTTIGAKRILTFSSITAKKMLVTIDKSDAPASLCEVEAYNIDNVLIEQ